RRHTRSTRDWSSDVCSSDLAGERRSIVGKGSVVAEQIGHRRRVVARDVRQRDEIERLLRAHGSLAGGELRIDQAIVREADPLARSEERRVGKECRRTRWWAQ